VLHDYDGTQATMRVWLAGLWAVVDAKGPDLSRAETVTLLNDLCLFAPAWLTDPRLSWQAVDDLQADVTFANGPYQVSARLVFNAADELVDFLSDDRGAMQPDGSIQRRPWSTPVKAYETIGTQRVMTYGEAVWHDPGGEFAYGKFTVTGLTHR
jgi:hypothetical protein